MTLGRTCNTSSFNHHKHLTLKQFKISSHEKQYYCKNLHGLKVELFSQLPLLAFLWYCLLCPPPHPKVIRFLQFVSMHLDRCRAELKGRRPWRKMQIAADDSSRSDMIKRDLNAAPNPPVSCEHLLSRNEMVQTCQSKQKKMTKNGNKNHYRLFNFSSQNTM